MIAHRAAGDAVGPSLDRKHIVLRFECPQRGQGGGGSLPEQVGQPFRCLGCQRDWRTAHHLRTSDHGEVRSEEHTSELQSLMRISYAVFCLKKKNYPNILSGSA